ncbi:SDR family oxidoreductase [Notoacmeibacter ruber]|uniref:SDR family oxidoreductase n=1 Tax=Notoacmeibacter ruber TaxID=2670375 RepID=A0A3L7JM05_9HYPH|nr:SDR family oxidoreductase [Notoacmeibacter ruber]RLQ89582.1 SDR family oxidoreductase [Notoacmeibacter ruber]
MDIPPQTQDRMPGSEQKLTPAAVHITDDYKGSGKLDGKVAVISGGDSGIGRAVALHFAREGAKIAILYLEETEDAEEARKLVEDEGAEVLLFKGDLGESGTASEAVKAVMDRFGAIDIVVNNAGIQIAADSLTEISDEEWLRHFNSNVHSMFYLSRAALPHLKEGARIINTTSINAFKGHDELVAYTTTKGAQLGFTRALANQLGSKGLLVNEVAPGPIWTPIQPATFGGDTVADLGNDTLLGRIGQPSEVAPAFVYLASADGSYVTGQTIHVNGGLIVGG